MVRVTAVVVGAVGVAIGLLQSVWWVFFAVLIGSAAAVRGMEGGTLLDNEYLQLLLVSFVPMLISNLAGLVGLVLVRQRFRRGLALLWAAAAGATMAALLHALLYPLPTRRPSRA